MAQRNSGYTRVEHDLYVTPDWVWERLYAVEPWAEVAWDPAPIEGNFDFLQDDLTHYVGLDIATNPPFKLADEFIQQSLNITETPRGRVAMLLPYTFDAAIGRVHLWKHPFRIRYNLTKRIRWDNLEQKPAGPSTNHCWYVWDWGWSGHPMVGWL